MGLLYPLPLYIYIYIYIYIYVCVCVCVCVYVYILLMRMDEIFCMYVEAARTDAGFAAIDISSLSLSVNPRVPVEGNVSGFRCLLLFL